MTATTETSKDTQTKKNGSGRTRSAESDVAIPPATDRVSRAAHDAIDSLKEPVAEAERKIRDVSSKAERQVREKQEAARTRTEEMLSQARDYAHREPLAAAGIAFAAGMLVSRLMRS